MSALAAPRDACSRLDDDSLRLICERVGPDGMFDVRCIEHIDYDELFDAQATLHALARVNARVSSIASAVIGQHVGPSITISASFLTHLQSSRALLPSRNSRNRTRPCRA